MRKVHAGVVQDITAILHPAMTLLRSDDPTGYSHRDARALLENRFEDLKRDRERMGEWAGVTPVFDLTIAAIDAAVVALDDLEMGPATALALMEAVLTIIRWDGPTIGADAATTDEAA